MTHRARGFTIVEILVVIIVIAILAAISIIVYNGINTRASEATLQSDLVNASRQLGLTHVENGSYPTSLPANTKTSPGNTLHYDQLGYYLSPNRSMYQIQLASLKAHAQASIWRGSGDGTKANLLNYLIIDTMWLCITLVVLR